MIIWPHLVPDLTHDAIFIDQEGLAVYAHERRAVHVFLFPDAIELGNSSIGIGKQSKGETVLVSKFLMGPDIISADTQHDDTTLLHNAVGITESASLLGTARRVIFWIEIQDKRSSFKVSQVHLTVFHHIVTSHRGKRKIRSRLVLFDLCITHNKSPLNPSLDRIYNAHKRKNRYFFPYVLLLSETLRHWKLFQCLRCPQRCFSVSSTESNIGYCARLLKWSR